MAWLICRDCGRHNAQGSESCVACGRDLHESLPQQTKGARSTAWLICGRCGRHNAQSESCVACGTDLNEPLPQKAEEARKLTRNRVVWAVTIPVILLVFGMCVAVVAPTAEPEATPTPYLAVAAAPAALPTPTAAPPPTAAPTPTAEPEATPSPYVAATAPAALSTSTAEPTPTAAKGLGLSIEAVKRRYSRLEFEADRLTDGRRRWMALSSDGSVLMEAIGDPENLEQITLMIDTGMSPSAAELRILGYLTFVLQDRQGLAAASASAWVEISMEAAAHRLTLPGSDGTYEDTSRLRDFELKFSSNALMRTIALTIQKVAP